MGGPWKDYAKKTESGPWDDYAPVETHPISGSLDYSGQTAPQPPAWAAKSPTTYGAIGAAAEVSRPLIEMGGLTAGALTGAPAGPAGSVAGGALGYAAGKRLTKAGDVMLGNIPPETATGVLAQTGRDIAEGAAYEAGGQIIGKVIPPVAGYVGEKLGKVIKPALGKLSGTGTGAVEEAIKSGKASAFDGSYFASKTAFDKALRGKITGDEIVENVKYSLNMLKEQRANEYRTALSKITQNQKRIDITPINDKLQGLMGTYNVRILNNGKIDTSRIAMGKTGRNDIEDIIQTVNKWGKQSGDDTAVGLDTLKRQLDDFYSDSSQARQFVTSLKKTVTDTISKSVPEYSNMTKGYADATNLIKDMEAGLMLRRQGMTGRIVADQTLRRLMSTMKDNKELSRDLVKILGQKTDADLTGQVAGYTMRSVIPQGLAGVPPIAIGGAAALKTLNPSFVPLILASSPRVQGEFLRLFGRMSVEMAGTAPVISKLGAYGITEGRRRAIESSNISESDKARFRD